ncbi:MAG: hypothetical protein ACE5G9_01135 [Nitrospinales bacterium]
MVNFNLQTAAFDMPKPVLINRFKSLGCAAKCDPVFGRFSAKFADFLPDRKPGKQLAVQGVAGFMT